MLSFFVPIGNIMSSDAVQEEPDNVATVWNVLHLYCMPLPWLIRLVWNIQSNDCSLQLVLTRISRSMVEMQKMRLHILQPLVFLLFSPLVTSMLIGTSPSSVSRLTVLESSQYWELCKAIQNQAIFGKSISTRSFSPMSSTSSLLRMTVRSSRWSTKISLSSYYDKLTTLI